MCSFGSSTFRTSMVGPVNLCSEAAGPKLARAARKPQGHRQSRSLKTLCRSRPCGQWRDAVCFHRDPCGWPRVSCSLGNPAFLMCTLRRPLILHAHQDPDCMLGHGSLSPLGMPRALTQLIHRPLDNTGVSAYLGPST